MKHLNSVALKIISPPTMGRRHLIYEKKQIHPVRESKQTPQDFPLELTHFVTEWMQR